MLVANGAVGDTFIDTWVDALAKAKSPFQLEQLDVSGCAGVSTEPLLRLLSKTKNMQRVRIIGCPLIDSGRIEDVMPLWVDVDSAFEAVHVAY